MTIEGRGVISRRPGEAALLEDILLDPPGPGEVLVRIQASGVCHTDLHYKLGKIGNEFPYLLGHEGAGIVEALGDAHLDYCHQLLSSVGRSCSRLLQQGPPCPQWEEEVSGNHAQV